MKELGLKAYAVSSLPDVRPQEIKPLRFGLYQPWTASMDEGWTRWVLEQFDFPFKTVPDAEIRAGRLADRYDAILLPDIRAGSIIQGASEGSMPKKYTGGIGEEGVFSLREFVREGGTLIAIDSSCDLLIEKLELPVKNIVAGSRRSRYGSGPEQTPTQQQERFFCPGSILRINVDNTHPLAFGLKPAAWIMYQYSPVFESVSIPGKGKGSSKDAEKGKVAEPVFVGTYPKVNPLVSGWAENDHLIHGKGALVQSKFGKGNAVLIGFRCQFRAQTHGTFKILFNAITNASTEFSK